MISDVSDVVVSKCGKDAGSKFFAIGRKSDYALAAEGRREILRCPEEKRFTAFVCRENKGGMQIG